MKKTSIAFLVLTCSTPVVAFDMSEWTRNSTSTSEQAQPQQSKLDSTPKQQPVANEIKTPNQNPVHLDKPKQGVATNTTGSIQPKQSIGSNYQPQNYPQQQGGYNNSTQHQVQQNLNGNGITNNNVNNAVNGLPSDLDPQTASHLDREASQMTNTLNQIMRINTNGYNLAGKQKLALDSYNGSLQMLASIWASSTQSERNKLDFELYNYSVGCATKTGVTNQARSLLSVYGQLNGMGGFAQHVQSRGKALGTTGPTMGC